MTTYEERDDESRDKIREDAEYMDAEERNTGTQQPSAEARAEMACEDMADVCELAHNRTAKECKDLLITMYRIEDGEEIYTEDAQAIFDRHYDRIIENTGL